MMLKVMLSICESTGKCRTGLQSLKQSTERRASQQTPT